MKFEFSAITFRQFLAFWTGSMVVWKAFFTRSIGEALDVSQIGRFFACSAFRLAQKYNIFGCKIN